MNAPLSGNPQVIQPVTTPTPQVTYHQVPNPDLVSIATTLGRVEESIANLKPLDERMRQVENGIARLEGSVQQAHLDISSMRTDEKAKPGVIQYVLAASAIVATLLGLISINAALDSKNETSTSQSQGAVL